MIEAIITALSEAVIWIISKLGYAGIVLSMAIESACIPLPSEIIMPFSGYLVWKGEMDLILVTLAGAFGNVIGSWVAYGAGVYWGRPFLEKYGRYVLLSSDEMERSEHWFAKYGDAAIFFSRPSSGRPRRWRRRRSRRRPGPLRRRAAPRDRRSRRSGRPKRPSARPPRRRATGRTWRRN